MERENLISKIEKWTNELTELDAKKWDAKYVDLFKATYKFSEGKKYIRIYSESRGSKSAFAFVDYDGNIYKCAGWNTPAKGVRAFIDNPPMSLTDLYKKYR